MALFSVDLNPRGRMTVQHDSEGSRFYVSLPDGEAELVYAPFTEGSSISSIRRCRHPVRGRAWVTRWCEPHWRTRARGICASSPPAPTSRRGSGGIRRSAWARAAVPPPDGSRPACLGGAASASAEPDPQGDGRVIAATLGSGRAGGRPPNRRSSIPARSLKPYRR